MRSTPLHYIEGDSVIRLYIVTLPDLILRYSFLFHQQHQYFESFKSTWYKLDISVIYNFLLCSETADILHEPNTQLRNTLIMVIGPSRVQFSL